MVMRVYKHTSSRYTTYGNTPLVPRGQVLEIDGHSELAISMSIHGDKYADWIDIEDYQGEISIKGRHVHEIISSILRFSSPIMRKHYRNLLDITEVATGDNKRDESSFSDADISFEKRRREREEKWNKKRSKKIRQFKLEMIREDRK